MTSPKQENTHECRAGITCEEKQHRTDCKYGIYECDCPPKELEEHGEGWEKRKVIRGDGVDPTRTVQQYHAIERILADFKNGKSTYSYSIEKIKVLITSAYHKGAAEMVEKCLSVLPKEGDVGMIDELYVNGFSSALSLTYSALTSLKDSNQK